MSKDLFIEYSPGTDLNFPLPEYQTVGSAGLDIRAFLPKHERLAGAVLKPGERL